MPAATSLEDIYHSLGCGAAAGSLGSLSSSYSPSSQYQLPDFYMRAAEKLIQPTLTVAPALDRQFSSGNGNANRTRNIHHHKQQLRTHNHHRKHPLNLSATAALAASNTAQRSRQLAYQYGKRQVRDMTGGSCDHSAQEPLLFLYHDEEISSASAPDSFFSMEPSRQELEREHPPTTGTAHHLTIEDLRVALNSCWLCGCNWQQDHVSLDCPECGGYALTRPCANCDGQCQQVWRRNINGSHDYHKALWVGECRLEGRQPDCCSGSTGASGGAGATPQTGSSTEARLRAFELRSDDDSDGYSDEDDCEHDGIQVAFGASGHCDGK